MPIKKRSTMPTAEEAATAEPTGKLNIVAKPKKPIPEGGKLRQTYGAEAPVPVRRRLGSLAIQCAAGTDQPDKDFTIEDRVALMRSPNNLPNTAEGRQEIRYRNRVRNRGTAITAYCITCVGGRKAITECADTLCPLWAFRFGSDPFYGKRKR